MQIAEITNLFEQIAPLRLQESYDNSGLIVGNKTWEVKKILLSLDCTEAVVEEAIKEGANLIVCHHPIVFTGLKRFNGNTYVERTILKAIKNDVAIYACHTNLDKVLHRGVNQKFAKKLGLTNTRILVPEKNYLMKLTVYVPLEKEQELKDALFANGAGEIGNYSHCSFSHSGKGSFMPTGLAKPIIGEKNKLETVGESALSVLVEKHKLYGVLKAMKETHPYEEVAYDLIPLENTHQEIGFGLIGELEDSLSTNDFLSMVKKQFNLKVIKHTSFNKKIKTVAVCGGSGQFLMKDITSNNADAYITSDIKYHQFFDTEGDYLLADIGHYESEISTLEIFHEIITENFPTFAVLFTKTDTNPVNYF